eukprot:gene30425-36766_t
MLVNEVFSSSNISTVLLLGPKQSYKSSLAFRLAYDDACKGGNPMYVCARAKLTTLPLEVSPSADPGLSSSRVSIYYPEILSRIRMKYVDSINELKQILLGLPCLPTSMLPTLLVVDDLTYLLDQTIYQHLPSAHQPYSSPQTSILDMKFLEAYVSVLAVLEDSKMFALQQHNHVLNICLVDSCVFLESEKGIWGRYVQGLVGISKSLQGEVQLVKLGGYEMKGSGPGQMQILHTIICSDDGKLVLV